MTSNSFNKYSSLLYGDIYIVPINNWVCELSNKAFAVYKLCLNIIFSVATLHNKIVKSALMKQQKSFEKLSTHEKND